jgi:AraC-like DNA-binding protein
LHIAFDGPLISGSLKEMGITLKKYVNTYRVEKAKELLATTDGPVADLAYQLGWASSNYFCTVFKKYTGVTPLQYRKQSRE